MKFPITLLILSGLLAGSCTENDPTPVETDDCLIRWNQIMGAEGGLSWKPGSINISLTDPKADEYGLDRVSTEVRYAREDETTFDRASASGFAYTDLDMIIHWEDLVLKDSVYVNLGFTDSNIASHISRHNKKVVDFHAQLMGLVLFHNRAELRMPFADTKVIPLSAFPTNGELIIRRRHSVANSTGNVKGTLVVKTVGVKDSLSYDGGGMQSLPYFGMYFTKDVVGTSSISINKFEFVEVKEPVVTPQDAESYSDSFECNSTIKRDY